MKNLSVIESNEDVIDFKRSSILVVEECVDDFYDINEFHAFEINNTTKQRVIDFIKASYVDRGRSSYKIDAVDGIEFDGIEFVFGDFTGSVKALL